VKTRRVVQHAGFFSPTIGRGGNSVDIGRTKLSLGDSARGYSQESW